MKTYLIYVIQGYDFYHKEKDLFMNTVALESIAKDEKEAVEKAKKMIKKSNYRVIACYEKINEK